MKNIVFSLVFFFLAIHTIKAQHDIKTIAKANNQFTFDMLKQLHENNTDLFFSPFSISTALSMTYAGAKNKTENEMQNVLHFEKNSDDFHNAYSKYINQIKNNKNINLNIANALWAQKGFYFEKKYINLLKNAYNTKIQTVDFKNNASKQVKKINKWVYKQTNKKIKDLLNPSSINALTRLVLVNAVYFQANWKTKFKPKKSYNDNFYLSNGKIKKCKFMTNKLYLYVYEASNYTAVNIPYKKNEASFVVILPQKRININQFVKDFSFSDYETFLNSMRKRDVELHLPKFKLTTQFNLSESLKNIGMPEAFSDNADFSGMTGKRDLKIDKVIHKAFVEVSESGTEAAAATGVVLMEKTAHKKKDIVLFKANHPFIFLIIDNSTNAILFSGVLENPEF